MFDEDARAFPAAGPIFGLDLGEKTIGVAVSDPDRRFALPVETIARTKFTADAEKLKAMAEARDIGAIVIGLPLTLAGAEGPSAQRSRAFARNLPRLLDLPIAFWDERLSTVAMERELIALGERRDARARRIDAEAAAFILQGALDRLAAIAGQEPP